MTASLPAQRITYTMLLQRLLLPMLRVPPSPPPFRCHSLGNLVHHGDNSYTRSTLQCNSFGPLRWKALSTARRCRLKNGMHLSIMPSHHTDPPEAATRCCSRSSSRATDCIVQLLQPQVSLPLLPLKLLETCSARCLQLLLVPHVCFSAGHQLLQVVADAAVPKYLPCQCCSQAACHHGVCRELRPKADEQQCGI